MAAASIGLSMALISTAKLLLVLCGLTTLLFSWHRRPAESALPNMRTPAMVLLAFFVFALSLFGPLHHRPRLSAPWRNTASCW
jgi:O-antigen ligase